ncbi:TOM1-like protein 2 [Centruroides sculpturatus]|uniref:TOM1-like protein 2 n=1 Tax=Centruroides sculpturatus TaxID=218467 RepID=UPI000C6CC3A1|nr:TOM1-like protein 2 [Centruroides sculpturatus]
MAAILAQLGGNPFNTPVGQKIEQATDASLASENWTVNMEICDIINETDEGPKDAVKAIRKRLQQNAGKNYTVVMYTLTVLETCVKNCGKRFHLLVTQKDFVQDLVKLIGPKNDPPTAVQEKVLSLIQSWADAFRAVAEMQGVVLVYNDLKQKGIEFPMTDLDAMAPIHTPQRSVPPSKPPKMQPVERVPPQVQPQIQPSSENVTSPLNLLPDQLAKLRSELDVVQGNMRVFGEMLTELTPGQEHPSDMELLQDLQKTCHCMQSRIVELIDKVANEEVTNELLRVNDELNNLFLRYERFEKKRTAVNQSGASPVQNKQSSPPPPQSEGKPLIDFGENEGTSADDIHNQLAGMGVGSASASVALSQINTVTATNKAPTHSNDDFDMFAQSRNVTYEQSKSSGSTYADNANPDQLQKEQDFAEMERWLQDKPPAEETQESITSSEFDKFLAERTAAAEKLPNVFPAEQTSTLSKSPTSSSSASSAGNRNAPNNAANRRKMDREDTDNALFAL